MTNPEKSFSFLHTREQEKEPVAMLRDSKRIKEDMRDILQGTVGDTMRFGIDVPVFREALSRITSPIPGIRVRNINAEIFSGHKNENQLRLSGKVTPIFVDKGLNFSVTIVTEDERLKVSEKRLTISFLSAHKQGQIYDLFNNIDSVAKDKLNRKIESLGEVERFHIGEKMVEWNVRKTKRPSTRL